MDLKDKMFLYGIQFGTRNTRRQKRLFIDQVCTVCKDKKVPVHVQQKTSSLLSVCNLIIGDPDKADTVIAASYDTPDLALFPQFCWYPFHMQKNRELNRMHMVIEACLFCLLMAAAIFLLAFYRPANPAVHVLAVIIGILLALSGIKVSSGLPVHISYNMNSASVAVIMDLIDGIAETGKHVCFVLYGEGTTSVEGVKILKEEIPGDKQIIFLSALAKGDYHFAIHAKGTAVPDILQKNLPEYEDHCLSEQQAAQSILALYPKGIILMSGDRDGRDLVVRNACTKKDMDVDMKLLQKTEDTLYELIEKEESTNV